MAQQPKPFLNNLSKLRNKAYGKERRLNMVKTVLLEGTPMPLPVEIKDIDNEFFRWVDEDLGLSFDGKKLPTFRLYSNQRIGEYAQSWQYLDDTGNLLMNFKTITRENNPKHGENQGQSYNIPGNRDYPMFMVPVLQENGLEAYDMYSMKQPYTINLAYSVTIITNKYEAINEMSQLVHDQFKAINCYIAPNGYYMPMTLDDIADESEYAIDDRKYYSQTYIIKVKAFIIREEDFKVQKVESRIRTRVIGIGDKHDKVRVKPQIEVSEEDYVADECCLRVEEDPYYNKLLKLIIKFPNTCNNNADFTFDTDMIIRSVETSNVYDFVMSVNEEFMDFENEIQFYEGDKLHFEISRNDLEKESSIIIMGFDPNTILDSRYNPESSLDDIPSEEEITFENSVDDK